MEITLPLSELKSALPGFARIVPRRPTLPVLGSLKITHSTDGTIHLAGTNLDVYLDYCCTSTPQSQETSLLVPFDLLQRVVKGSSSTGSVVLSNDGNRTTLSYPLAGQLVEQPVPAMALQEWPTAPAIEGPEEVLDDNFKSAVSNAFACCSEDTLRAALVGAWIDVTDPKAHYAMGTDGRHLDAANSFKLALPEALLLPHEKFLDWGGFKDDGVWKLILQPAKPNAGTGWVQLQSDHWTFSVKRPDHSIPNWRQVIPSTRSFKVRVQFTEASSAFLVDLLPKLPGKNEGNQAVQLTIAGGKLSVSAHAMNVPVEDVVVTGPDMAIAVNRSFVAKALKWGLTVMEMTDALSPLVFSTKGKRLVAMPVRQEPVSPAEPTPQEQPMSRSITPTVTTSEPEPVQPVNRLAPTIPEPKATETKPTVRTVMDQVDGIRESLKSLSRQCGELVDGLRQIEKDKRATDREVEQVRDKLRAIQSVSL